MLRFPVRKWPDQISLDNVRGQEDSIVVRFTADEAIATAADEAGTRFMANDAARAIAGQAGFGCPR